MVASFLTPLERLRHTKKLYALAALAGGALAGLALAPISWGWLFFIFVPLMMLSLDLTPPTGRASFWLGFSFGFGYNLVAFYWIGHAFLLSHVPFLIPLSVLGLPTLFGGYWGLSFWASRRFWGSPLEKVLSFSFFWTLCFLAQGFLWSGYPWNFPAQGWIELPALAQNFHWLGIYGATFLMIAGCASLYTLTTTAKQKFLLPALTLGLFVALWGWGAARLSHAEVRASDKEVIVVQPNIIQKQKWNPRFARKIITTYFQLSKLGIEKPRAKKKVIMVWPEASLPINIEKNKNIRAAIGSLLPDEMILVAGFVRLARPQAFNSLFVLDSAGNILSHYDKNHLVPFGEYLPLQSFLETLGARQITGSLGGYGAGAQRKLLASRALPLICFEISFPEEMLHEQRPDWIVNITNDGWYEDSAGPYQHFQLAQIRAIEFGIPVVRAANTGISAVIDPYGRVIKKIPLEKQGVLREIVPAPLSSTLYAFWGEWLFVLFLVINAVALFTFPRALSDKNKP